MSNEMLKLLKNKRKGVKTAATFDSFINSLSNNVNIYHIHEGNQKFLTTYHECENIQSQIEELDELQYDK